VSLIQPKFLHIIPIIFDFDIPRAPEKHRTKRNHIVDIRKIKFHKCQIRFTRFNRYFPVIDFRSKIRPVIILTRYFQNAKYPRIRNRCVMIVQVKFRLERIERHIPPSFKCISKSIRAFTGWETTHKRTNEKNERLMNFPNDLRVFISTSYLSPQFCKYRNLKIEKLNVPVHQQSKTP